jgi:membrane protein involved in colicin uptake
MTDEALRRADRLLSELIETIETARAVPMSSSCVVPREHLLDLLDELREVMPPEMDEARTVIARRDKMLQEGYEAAAALREQAIGEADAVLADAATRAEQVTAEAERVATDTVQAARDEHARLVASTTVHQAAAQAAAALREDAERYQQQITADAKQYEAKVCADADRYAQRARSDAERYATKLTVDAENYAEQTLDELSAVLHRSAQTAEQGRVALAQRRAGAFAAGSPVPTGPDARIEGPATDDGDAPRAAISA